MTGPSSMPEGAAEDSLAVIGLACRFPGAPDAEAFWRLLAEQRDAITAMPVDRFDPAMFNDRTPGDPGMIATRRGGFLRDIDGFDAGFFGLSPREAAAIDPQHRLLLETAWEACEDAGLLRDQLRGASAGVFVGIWTGDYERIAAAGGDVDLFAATGTGRYAAAGRLSYAFDLRGPSLTVDTACSSSLVALHLASQSLRTGESDLAIVGAANLILDPLISVAYSRSGLLSTEGRCAFADADPTGYVRSEGVAVLILQRTATAVREGNRIRARILGSAVNNDGASSGSLVAPSSAAQTALARAALAAARVSPERVQYIEAHGTGTKVGDPTELRALAEVLGSSRHQPCLIGSVKTNIGHTEAASGLAGLIKVVLTLEHGVVPASLSHRELTPEFDWSGAPLRLCTSATPLDVTEPAIAAVNSFGITGTNAQVILRQAEPLPRHATRSPGPYLIPLSSHSPASLQSLVEDWRQRAWSGVELSDVAFTAGLRRAHHRYRRAIVADEAGDIVAHLAAGPDSGPPHQATRPPVFVFSGHGSQWPGMGRVLLEREQAAADALEACARALQACGGPPVVDLIRRADAAALEDISVVQPLLFALQVAVARTWISWGISPGACVGHSMGEVAAAHVAGILSLDDAARIICSRSALLASRRGLGAMALIDAPATDVGRLIAPYGARISIAAINDAHATVVSGDPAAIADLLITVEASGGFARSVQVDVAAHSAQVDDLVERLAQDVSAVRPMAGTCPLYSTVTGDRVEATSCDAAYWARNLRAPVQFQSAVQAALRDGFRGFVEVSPHPIAVASVQQEAREHGVAACVVASQRRDHDGRRSMLEAAGELFTAGYDLHWPVVVPSHGRVVSLPTPKWNRTRLWLDRRTGDRRSRAVPLQSDPAAANRGETLPDIFEFAWTEVPTPACDYGRAGRWLVIDGGGTGGAIAAAAAGRGVEVDVVSDQPMPDRFFDGVGPSDVLIVAPTFARWHEAEWAAVEPAMLGSVTAVLSVARSLTERATRARLWLVTAGALGIARDLVDPVNTAMAALIRVVLEEHPDLAGGLIDLSGGVDGDAPAAVVAHVLAPRPPREVAIAGSLRWVRRLQEVRPEGRPLRVRSDGTYLITGGFGGVGMAVAERLADRGARHIALMARCGLPPRDTWSGVESSSPVGLRIAAVQALERRGLAVHVVTADVGDASALADALAALAAAAPPVAGVVHAAAVVHDHLALATDVPTFTEVVRAKAAGAWNLLRHFADAPPDFIVYCSSIGSLIGLTGQASYAAANGLLDGLACHARSRGLPLTSVNWGPWHDTGLLAAHRGARDTAIALARDGLGGFDRSGGLEAFEAVVSAAVPQAAVLTLDRGRLAQSGSAARHWLTETAGGRPDQPSTRGAFRRHLEMIPRSERLAALDGELRGALGRILRLPANQIPSGASLGSLGLESLMALEFQRQVEHLLDERLPKTLVWRTPTLEALTDHLMSRIFPQAAAEPPRRTMPRVAAVTESDALAALMAPREKP
jgi:acyl transferase domain-containing protein